MRRMVASIGSSPSADVRTMHETVLMKQPYDRSTNGEKRCSGRSLVRRPSPSEKRVSP